MKARHTEKGPESGKGANGKKGDLNPPQHHPENPLWRHLSLGTQGVLQRKPMSGSQGNTASNHVESAVKSSSDGEPLIKSVKERIEPVLGADLSTVRVHKNRTAQQAAKSIGAKAFTHQKDIFLGQGQRADDIRLMAHEATHTLQQGGSGVVQREPEDEQQPEVNLSNDRFSSDRILLRIARGNIDALSARHNGRNGAVSKVQRALVDMGFDLPLHRVDGSYGGETEEAIRQFREYHMSVPGTQLDSAAMIRLDQLAPQAGQRIEHNFDYERLFADNRLDITVAFGYSDSTVLTVNAEGEYEEGTEDVAMVSVERFREWLEQQGFELELLGINSDQHWKVERTITFPMNDGSQETRDISIWVQLIQPGEGAAMAFRHGLADSEVTIYAGHARYGSGPDFDAKASPEENFRIGIDTALQQAGRPTRYEHARRHHVVMDAEHDLQDMVASGEFDPDRYRILFFKACTSMAYLDEIRSELGGSENIDVIGSRVPTMYTRVQSNIDPVEIKALISGILDMQTAEQIVDSMEQSQQQIQGDRAPSRGIFTTSGLGDNPVAGTGSVP